MEPTVTVETVTIWQALAPLGLIGVFAFAVSTLLILGGTLGLIIHKSKHLFYIWLLGICIRLNVMASVLVFANGIAKFWWIVRSFSGMGVKELFYEAICELMGGISLLIGIAFIGFIIKTVAEIKQKFTAN